MAQSEHYDAHAQPPDALRVLFKKWQRSTAQDIAGSTEILDLDGSIGLDRVTEVDFFSGRASEIQRAIHDFLEQDPSRRELTGETSHTQPFEGYEVNALPGVLQTSEGIGRGCLMNNGLLLFPALLSNRVQRRLLDRLLHRDLSNPQHNTNIHLFHDLVYPSSTGWEDGPLDSFFAMNPNHQLLAKDTSTHKPMTVGRMLQRKLRWLLLGGQYDWTAKIYPQEAPPLFPVDISHLLKALFPSVDAEAAIINFYTPGDSLSVHRDVSEECDRGLISISLGCDCLFLIGKEDDSTHTTIRLRSGDAVLMTGESRFAWHAVPKILPDTCPAGLETWPACEGDSRYEHWRGWMKSKRINVNVRQIKETGSERIQTLRSNGTSLTATVSDYGDARV